MAESTPPTFEQFRQLNRSLNERVLDRAQSDPQWRQRLLDDPELAMHEANFPEIQQLEAAGREEEVRGQVFDVRCDKYCTFWSAKWWGTRQ